MLENQKVLPRQTAFFAAFILPVYKLLETPSLLARYAKGDLLFPALLHFLWQTGILLAVLYIATRSETPLIVRLRERLGKGMSVFYILYGVFFLLFAVLPLLDLEKFVYAVFYDTAPTLFSFAFFFLFSAFVCVKGYKSLARQADLSLFLFLLPFLALVIMSLAEADLTGLFPVFERAPKEIFKAVNYTTPHFTDIALLFPLIAHTSFKKTDGKKVVFGYTAGSVIVLVFLAVFYGVYSTVAFKEHYAFSKIAQYFPALAVVGRIDLIFVYALCLVLFVFVAAPLFFATESGARLLGEKKKPYISAVINLAAFLFVFFCNKYYDGIYRFISTKLTPVYWVLGNILPLCCLFLFLKGRKKNEVHAQ